MHEIALRIEHLVAVRALPAPRLVALFDACQAQNMATAFDHRVLEVYAADVADGEGLKHIRC